MATNADWALGTQAKRGAGGGAWRAAEGSRLRPIITIAIAAVLFGHYLQLGLSSGVDVDTKGALYWLNLFAERSAGTWLNALLLGAIAVPAAACALAAGTVRLRRGWLALAGLALLLSIDEVAGLHESAIELMRDAAGLSGALRYAAWTLPAVAVMAAFLVWQWRFFRVLPRSLASRIALGGLLYVVAAVGFEVLQSLLLTGAGDGERWTPFLQATVGLEEGLEMVAAAVVLLAVLRHLGEIAPSAPERTSTGGYRRWSRSGLRTPSGPFSSSATHSMCGVWGNMSTGRTFTSRYPASTICAALGASVVGLQET